MRSIIRHLALIAVAASLTPMGASTQSDVLVFRSSDGAFWKWYGGPATTPGFPGYQAGQYIGGTPGAVPGAQMIPMKFNGDV